MNVTELLSKLDGSGSDIERDAIKQLRERVDLPSTLLQHYKSSKSWRTRSACVFYSTTCAKSSEAAVQLGLIATQDRSQVVRYRAAMLLSIAQSEAAIDALEKMQARFTNSAADAAAAISAIQGKNHHLFVDRDGSGMVTLNVGME